MFSLHAHSNYSLLQSTITIDELVAFAKNSGSSYVALTDVNAMYGLIEFYKTAQENNLKPILGTFIDDPGDKNLNALFIAKNNEGYSRICQIITTRKLKDGFSLPELFKEPLENLFVITSSIELLKQIRIDLSLRHNLFVELVVTKKTKRKTRILYEFAKENRLQLVATHPAYFGNEKDFLLHKTITAIRLNTTLANLDEANFIDEEFYLKSPKELEETWKGLPEAISNSDKIAKQCDINLELGKHKFPSFPKPNNEESYSLLWKITFEG